MIAVEDQTVCMAKFSQDMVIVNSSFECATGNIFCSLHCPTASQLPKLQRIVREELGLVVHGVQN
ncbi:hypothetical protein BC941DRAFT_443220 [Chlamydoabsidia padenii]|nr:hypothetical protein BC941DRAFT_443220 [Chlamydoabsidia padenii]